MAVDHAGDALEPVDVLRGVAAELELEVREAVALHGGGERSGQAVGGRVWSRIVVVDGIGQADGVARGDAGAR
ncbi:hypothetical protein FQZ97_1100940 [compost metagenome]